jgi:hypothetical protein
MVSENKRLRHSHHLFPYCRLHKSRQSPKGASQPSQCCRCSWRCFK